LRRLASVAAHRLGRQTVRRAPLVRHPSGTTARRTRKPPEAVHENACVAGVTKWRGRQKFLGRNHLRQGCSGQEDCKGMTLFEPALFASPAERAVSCGPKGPFVSGGAAWPDRAQGRCDADGEAKPQAVRRRAFIEVAARRPAARRFSWLRASASLPCAQAQITQPTHKPAKHTTKPNNERNKAMKLTKISHGKAPNADISGT
jgi:hypothetical protein